MMPEVKEMQKVGFKPVHADDVAELKHISVRVFCETFRQHNTPENLQAYLDAAYNIPQLLDELANPQSAFYFVKLGEDVIGYIKFRYDMDHSDSSIPPYIRDAKSLMIERFYLQSDHHGKGIAHRMMQFCVDTAKEHKAAYLWLGVWEKNMRAQAFYKKWNFAHVGQHLFQLGDEVQTDYWLAYTL